MGLCNVLARPALGLPNCAKEASGSSGGQHHKVMVSGKQMTVYKMWG